MTLNAIENHDQKQTSATEATNTSPANCAGNHTGAIVQGLLLHYHTLPKQEKPVFPKKFKESQQHKQRQPPPKKKRKKIPAARRA